MIAIRALRSEFAKLFTVRLWWILLLVLVGYIAFMAALLAVVFEALPELATSGKGAPHIPEGLVHSLVYSTASSVGYVFPVLFGALATTAEFRNQTLTPTFLAIPRRGAVLVAKLVALAVVGALYGVAALVASVGVGGTVIGLLGGDAALDSTDTWAMLGRIVIAMALWAVIGVALGTLVRSQVAAIVIVLAFTQFLEPILRLATSFVDGAAQIGKFLPGAAGDALVGASIFTTLGTGGGASSAALDWWQGGLVLLAIAVVAAALGYVVTWRKDVT